MSCLNFFSTHIDDAVFSSDGSSAKGDGEDKLFIVTSKSTMNKQSNIGPTMAPSSPSK